MADDIVLGVKIKIDGREVDGQVRLLTDDLNRLTQAQQNQANAAQQSAAQTGGMLNTLRGTLREFAVGVASAFTVKALFDFGVHIIKVNSEMEDLRATLTSVTGSAQASAQAFSTMQDFARDTPFEVRALTDTFIKLRSFGLEPTNQTMLAITNQASKLGASTETLNGITLALGQAWAKGKLQGEEILQLVERGVPVWEILAKATGKNSAELQKMSEKGELGRAAIQELTVKMGELASGANADAVNTISGAVSNFSDAWIRLEDNLLNSDAENAIKRFTTRAAENISYLADILDELNVKLTGISTPKLDARISESELKRMYADLEQQKLKVQNIQGSGGRGPIFDAYLAREKQQLEDLQKTISDKVVQRSLVLDQFRAQEQRAQEESSARLKKSLSESAVATDAHVKSSTRAITAEQSRRRAVMDTIEAIKQETALIGLSEKERSRAVELTHSLAKAKGAEVEAIKSALQAKWAELDADQRRNDMWAEMVDQANALDKLHDDAAEAQRLAKLAEELRLQGKTNDEIRERIALEKELKDTIDKNPDLDPKQVEDYVRQRKSAEKTINDVTDGGSQKTADFMEAAWKRAAENIQDSMAQMFENLLNGDALKSFSDFFNNIQNTISKTLGQIMAQNFQGMIKKAFTNGGGGINSLLGDIFSMGKSGGFSMTSMNGGGFGWATVGALAKMIPGAGSVNWQNGQQNKSLQTVVGLENSVTDMVGNFFPLFKLIAPLKNMVMNFGAKLFPGRKPSLIGHMLGQAFGPLGDLLGTFLMGEKIPQPTEWTKGRYSNGKMTIGKSGAEEGGNKQNTIDFTKQFGDMVTRLGHQLNMSFRDFNTMFTHQLDKTGKDQFEGGLLDKGGQFWARQLSSGGNFKTLADEAALAVIKRNRAGQDDLHYREAIRDSKSLKQLSKAIEKIDSIGLAVGEYGQALQQLKEINAQFDDMAIKAKKYRFAEADIEAARQRAIAALKNDTLTAFRQLAGLGPTLAAQLGALNDQLIALEANARSLKIAESELTGLRAKAIAQAREQYLAPLTDATSSIADQIATLTGALPTPEDTAPLYELLKQSTDPTEQARYIARIQSALTRRYNIEIAAINKTAQAVGSLRDFVDSLKLSNLSPLDPEQRLREAQGQYGTDLLKAQAGDQAALGRLAGSAQAYLTEARSYYASSPQYAEIFANVSSTLNSFGDSLGGNADAEDAASAAANQLAGSLQSLADLIASIVAQQGSAFDQQAGDNLQPVTGPTKNFQDITEEQMAANIDALPDSATKAQKAAVKAANALLAKQIKAWLFGGDDELQKTQAYQELTGAIQELKAQINAAPKNDPNRGYMTAQLSGLTAQRKALGKVKFKERGGWTSGMTVVGENGPELIDFERPTRVQNHRQTQAIIAGGNDAVIAELRKTNAELTALVKLQVAANQALVDRLDRLAASMGAMERKTRLGSAA
ncbi:tape measure protein [Methylomicrobium sp. Wu6]|uniref:tape measure protein n=1 Tax=Methylomicrobium sp. Wu6 TaxID=3107928 RepID=UPI002DD631FE|nr:tape measure protein [Methylomicrobium sp. Wu6]MEC4750053.1 tape measure protein [Methylomicrobium sp. Wu6]